MYCKSCQGQNVNLISGNRKSDGKPYQGYKCGDCGNYTSANRAAQTKSYNRGNYGQRSYNQNQPQRQANPQTNQTLTLISGYLVSLHKKIDYLTKLVDINVKNKPQAEEPTQDEKFVLDDNPEPINADDPSIW